MVKPAEVCVQMVKDREKWKKTAQYSDGCKARDVT